MIVADVFRLIDSVAPFSSQEGWDNSGLIVGSLSAPVSGILFALDATEPVIREACRVGASLIVTHHPLMISPRRSITDDNAEGRLIGSLIRNGISLIAAHTNLDRAPGGINDTLAHLCGISVFSGDGFFRSGLLPDPVQVSDYSSFLAGSLSASVRVMGPSDRFIQKIGLSSGGGGDAWQEAALTGCDAFVTGEMKHHLALSAADAGLVVLECGHFATEEPGIRAFAETLQKEINRIKYNIGFYVSEIPAYSFSQQP